MKSTRPLIEHIPSFLDYCEVEKGLSLNTQRNYGQYLELFSKWLVEEQEDEGLLPHKLTAKHIWDYRLYLARSYKTQMGDHLRKRSQNYYLIALRAFLAFLSDRDIESLPSSKVKLAKQKIEENISFLDLPDIEKILDVPDVAKPNGLRDRTIMELFFSSGMRISELLSLDQDQMSVLQDKKKNKTYELSIIGKGQKPRTIFISPRATHWLRKYLEQRRDVHKPLFINYRSKDPSKKRLSARYVQMMISRYARLAGISKKVTPHTLRHTYATDLLSHGADLRSVQELLGHRNVSTTQVYTHVTNKQLRNIHEKYHGGKNGDDSSYDE